MTYSVLYSKHIVKLLGHNLGCYRCNFPSCYDVRRLSPTPISVFFLVDLHFITFIDLIMSEFFPLPTSLRSREYLNHSHIIFTHPIDMLYFTTHYLVFSHDILRFLTREVFLHCITCLRGSEIFLIGIIKSSSPSFHLPYYPSQRYDPSRKTTLRP